MIVVWSYPDLLCNPDDEVSVFPNLVEEDGGKISGFEFKWSNRKRSKLPKTFLEAYDADSKIITRDNFREFVTITRQSLY